MGEDGAHAVWLVAARRQDPAFQRRCLDLLTAAVVSGEATIVQQAYLTDRVVLHEGKPQEYGMQAIARDGRFEPRKLRDPDHVDQRRASVGLGSLAGYLARMTGTAPVSLRHERSSGTAIECQDGRQPFGVQSPIGVFRIPMETLVGGPGRNEGVVSTSLSKLPRGRQSAPTECGAKLSGWPSDLPAADRE